MTQTLSFHENQLNLVLEVNDAGDVRLVHFSLLPYDESSTGDEAHRQLYRLAEVQVSGEDYNAHHGLKHIGTMPGGRLRYNGHTDVCNSLGRKLEIAQEDAVSGLKVVSHLQFYDGLPVVRSWTEASNLGMVPVGLEYISSFALSGTAKEGLQPWDQKMRLHVPHNTWTGEVLWSEYTLPELGLASYNTMFTMKRVSIKSGGTWSTGEYLPMGCLENRETGTWLFWQIEHQGAWHWEVGEVADFRGGQDLYLNLSGPNESEHQWWKLLEPGETFVTVPAAIGVTTGGFDPAMSALTQYRRKIRRPNLDNENLPVIFNDYMNCLNGDPTTEKELPLIEKAAEVGCEYFVIDAGWYDDGDWWSNVGEWMPSQKRFPGGLQEVLDGIRAKGMIPGLWLELEVMGVHNAKALALPDDWFFCRHGKRVIDHGRFQLDYRNPQVVTYANAVIERLVKEYGVGYIKMDYNINAGVGTETNADSFGDGLLGHQRAYLDWLDNIFARYPDLVIENCSSGGMRMDYALLSRQSLQSSSDQTDYRKYARIAAAGPSAVTPEQFAVWSYPLTDGDEEEVVFNMVNALLLRIHQSGHMVNISPERRALVQEGLAYYKAIRHEIPRALPFWPIGMPKMGDGWMSMGLRAGEKSYLAVWRLDTAESTCLLPIHHLKGHEAEVSCGYPAQHNSCWQWHKESGVLSVSLPQANCARLFELK